MRSHEETWKNTVNNIKKAAKRLTEGVIIILDDDQDFLDTIGALLQNCGRRVLVTTNPYEFFKLLGGNYVEAAIVDLNLREMNGLGVLKEVHQRKIKKAIISDTSKDDIDLPDGIGYISKNNGRIDMAILEFLEQGTVNGTTHNG